MAIPLALLLVALGIAISLIMLRQYLNFILSTPKRILVVIRLLEGRKERLIQEGIDDIPDDSFVLGANTGIDSWIECPMCKKRGYVKLNAEA